jgi:hypothetical protein
MYKVNRLLPALVLALIVGMLLFVKAKIQDGPSTSERVENVALDESAPEEDPGVATTGDSMSSRSGGSPATTLRKAALEAPARIAFPDADPSLVDAATVDQFLRTHPNERYRLVNVNGDAIRALIRDELRGVHRKVTLELFPDAIVVAEPRRVSESNSLGVALWSAKEVGAESAPMTLTIGPDGRAMGEFVTSKGLYGIDVTTQPPLHIVWQWPSDAASAPVD